MTRLKLGPIQDEKPVKMTVELPADVHRDLCSYGTLLARQTGQELEPTRLIAPMLAHFMSSDRGFAKARKARKPSSSETP
ncbi:MAG: DUF2274 domain-containing protein [Pseudomonadota bacterium]